MIKILWNKKYINFLSATWSGTDNQCSRILEFTVPHNPYDKDFENASIKLGDLVYLYDGNKQIFVGTITNRERGGEIGNASYTASDFMQHLLRSTATYKFKNATPEKIVKKVCGDLQIKVGSLAKTNVKIPKIIFEEQSIYDIIIAVYRKAKKKNGKNYLPIMDGKKVSVIEKGKSSEVTLRQGGDISGAEYSDTTENIVNKVNIYSESNQKLGKVENKNSTEKYGIFQTTYKKEKGVNAKEAAKALMSGVSKEASVESIGNINAISGRSVVIYESAAKISGKFYISSDSHTFENGAHTMSLELKYHNSMEQGAESTTKDKNSKKKLKNAEKCYYLDGSTVYHSTKNCSACKGKKLNSSTVEKIKKIKITVGKNKGKRKFKACSKCWEM